MTLVRLDWDCGHFGMEIAKLEPANADAATIDAALAEGAARGVDCLCFAAALDAPATLAVAARRGFRLVDVRVELGRSLREDPSPPYPPLPADGERGEIPVGGAEPLRLPVERGGEKVRLANSSDLPALRALAGASHGDSRYYADGRFPRERCDALFEAWIANSAAGWAAGVLVLAGADDEPLGYCTCHVAGEVGTIGLFAVDPRARGRGAGPLLLETSLEFFRTHGCRQARVVTQGANVRAQRLYQKCGFRTERTFAWLHRWAEENR